jgi:hypothetical protein
MKGMDQGITKFPGRRFCTQKLFQCIFEGSLPHIELPPVITHLPGFRILMGIEEAFHRPPIPTFQGFLDLCLPSTTTCQYPQQEGTHPYTRDSHGTSPP